jgi:Ni/Co efflux regulator RcnB
MTSVSKFLVLSAVAALMIATTVVVAASDADATTRIRDSLNRNNVAVDSQVGQQNSGDVDVGGGDNENDDGDNVDQSRNAAGGNYVGDDLNQDADDSFNDEED